MMLEGLPGLSWVCCLPLLHLSDVSDGMPFSRSASLLQPGSQHLVGVKVDVHWHLSSTPLQAPRGDL